MKTYDIETVRILKADLDRIQAQLDAAARAARASGCTWQQIGHELGITKQRAQQKYGKEPSKILATDVAGDSVTPSIFSDAPAPAKTKTTSKKVARTEPAKVQRNIITGITVGPPHVKAWPNGEDLDPRPEFVLRSAGAIDGVSQPGTGKGPHQCPRCGSTNHKSGHPDTIRAYLDCKPTKYDPQDITDHLNTTGLSH